MYSKRSCQRIVVLAVAALPLLIASAMRVETNTDDIQIWLPQGTAARQSYDRFTELFGQDDEIIFSWPGCTPDDPRRSELISKLIESNQRTSLFTSIISGETILRELSEKKFSYPESVLRRRLDHIFFDPSDNTTAIIAQMSDVGRSNGHKCIEEICHHADLTAGLSRDDLRIGGDAYTTVQIDNATGRSLLFAGPAALMAILITLICLRSLRLTLTTLTVSGYSALMSVALVSILGFKINGLLVMMPVLVLVLSLSATVHLCSYYKRAIQLQSADSVALMLRMGWRPCVFAMLTTAVGVGMLLTSHVQAVRIFGFFSSLALIASLASILVIFPAVLKLWPISTSNESCQQNRSRRLQIPWRPTLNPGYRRYATAVVLLFLAATPLLVRGLSQVKSTLQTEKMFSAASDVNRNSRWLTDKFSAVKNIELIATFEESTADNSLVLQIRKLKALQRNLSEIDQLESVFSVASVTRLPARTKNAKTVFQEKLIEDALHRNKQDLIDRRLLAVEDGSWSWRIRCGVNLDDDADYASVIQAIEHKCSEVTGKMVQGPQCWVTGIWALTTAGRHQVFSDLSTSFMLAFAIITPLVVLVLRGLAVGLVAMIPNVMPAAMFFGIAGLSGMEIDIGTVLTASVGLGIAVDDTLHFLHCFIRYRKQGQRRDVATFNTMKQCFRPMLYTTLICSFGLCLFAFSEFLPARQFALAIVTLMFAALVCDLVLLPALILSPIGRIFEGQNLAACQKPSANKPAPAKHLPATMVHSSVASLTEEKRDSLREPVSAAD